MPNTKDLDNYFHNIYQIILNSGRTIKLTRLTQWQTYEGLLVGLPDYNPTVAEILCNEFKLDHGHTIIIDASAVPLPISEETKDYYRNHSLWRHMPQSFTSLAPITCVGKFESAPIDGDTFDGSMLNMIWFQQQYAMPIAAPMLDKIKAVDWDILAEKFEF